MCKVAVAVFLVICVIAATSSKNDVRWLQSADQNRCAAVSSRRLANCRQDYALAGHKTRP
jgi:hypothetical protein